MVDVVDRVSTGLYAVEDESVRSAALSSGVKDVVDRVLTGLYAVKDDSFIP